MKVKFTSEYIFEVDAEQDAIDMMSNEMADAMSLEDLYEIEIVK